MHGEAAARLDAVERVLEMLAEQHAIGQVGQHVVARQMRDLGLGAPPLGDVLVHRDPAAVLHRALRHRDDPAVHQFLGEGRGLARRGSRSPPPSARDWQWRRCRSSRDSCRSPAADVPGSASSGVQRVHLHIGLVADDQLLLGVEHAQPVRHVVQRDVDAAVELLELDLACDQLDGVVLEHLDGARHRADLVAIVARRNDGRGVVARKPDHRLGDAGRAATARGASWQARSGRSERSPRRRDNSTHTASDFAVALTKAMASCASCEPELAVVLDQPLDAVGDMGVVVGLLDRLVLREFVGIERDLVARPRTATAGFRRCGFPANLDRPAAFRRDLRHQRRQPALDLVKLVAIRLKPVAIHLRRHALDDAAMIGEQKLKPGRVQHAEKAVAVEMLRGAFRGPRKIDRGDRQRTPPRAATERQSNRPSPQCRRRRPRKSAPAVSADRHVISATSIFSTAARAPHR